MLDNQFVYILDGIMAANIFYDDLVMVLVSNSRLDFKSKSCGRIFAKG